MAAKIICGYTDAAAGQPGNHVCTEPALPGRYATFEAVRERRSACAIHAEPERLGHCTTTYDHSPACLRDGSYCGQVSTHPGPCKPHGSTDREALIARAWELRNAGASMYAIALELGVSKDWLRHYAAMGAGL